MSLHVDVTGAGPDLVLLHGWGLNSAVWAETAAMLALHLRVHAIDLPGHGRSRQPAAGFDAAADAIAAHIPPGAVVCGWSMGGLLAQRIARRHAARVRRLVLVSSTPRFVADDEWDHGMERAALEGFAQGLATDLDRTLATFVKLNALRGARGRPAIRELTERLASRPPPSREALEHGLAWLRQTDLRVDAPWVATPTLVVHGARDAIVPVGAGRWLAQALPHATLAEWPDAAHLPFFTHREAFVSAVEAFVG